MSEPIPESRCPGCNYLMNRASEIRIDALPRAGDCSLCLNCGHILIFNRDLSLRAPSPEEIAELMNDRDAWGKIELVQREISRRGPLHT